MKQSFGQITLKHLLINNKKYIGIQFIANKSIEAILQKQNLYRWNETYNMYCALNTPDNLNFVFSSFRGVSWINGAHFFESKRKGKNESEVNLDAFRLLNQHKKNPLPEAYLTKLEQRRYSLNTAKTYISCFEKFMEAFSDQNLLSINELEIQNYLKTLSRKKTSSSYLNQMINSIKFYYETVLKMPNRFYIIDRPMKSSSLPKVISQNEVKRIIESTNNVKHKCIVSVLYSAGIRRQELLDLKIEDIDSERMLINIRQGKGKKDRVTVLSKKVLIDLRLYFKEWQPKTYLFEGKPGQKYGASSIGKIIDRAAKKAKISKKVTPHMLRHSFATHLLESGTSLRHIQTLLGHNSSKTTEIYTRVTLHNIQNLKSPIDSLV